MTQTAMIEKARKPKAIQDAPVYVSRSIFRFWDPSGFSPEQWRLIAREPINKMAQQFIKRELVALDFEIVSDERKDPRVDEYKERWDAIFDDGDGFYVWLFRILDDTMTLTFGGGSEVSRTPERLDWIQHVDAATLLPTYDKRQPYVQVNPDNWVDRIYFRENDLARLRYGPRPEIHFKEWQLSPVEEALLPIEALSKIYMYYMQELTDTPAMGILDVMDMTYEEATKWSKDFRAMMQGTDPLKIPILYEHNEPARWIPFNRSPADLNIPELFKRFAEVLLGKYGLSIGDLRLFEHESTKAGERVSQMVTERSGVGYWAALIAQHLTRLLPNGLTFKFRQPRPERDKTVADRKLTQIAMLQAAAGQKQLISVEDAVEEAMALEIFTTPVKPKEEKEQEDIFGPLGGPGGKPPQFGNQSKEDQDEQNADDLTKGWVTDMSEFVTKALTTGWRHPEPLARDRLNTLMRVSFAKSGYKADQEQIGDIEELIRTSLEVLGPDAEVKGLAEPSNGRLEDPPYPFESAEPLEKGGSGSGNWAHAGRPGERGGISKDQVLERVLATPATNKSLAVDQALEIVLKMLEKGGPIDAEPARNPSEEDRQMYEPTEKQRQKWERFGSVDMPTDDEFKEKAQAEDKPWEVLKRRFVFTNMTKTQEFQQGLWQGRIDKACGLDFLEKEKQHPYNLGYAHGYNNYLIEQSGWDPSTRERFSALYQNKDM